MFIKDTLQKKLIVQKYHILISIFWIISVNQKLVFIKDIHTNQLIVQKYHKSINIPWIILFNQKTSVHQGYFAEKVNRA